MNHPDALLKDLLAHDAWIRVLARRLVADRQSAEDIAQEAWVEALRRPPSKPESTRAWLRRVVKNLAFKGRRSDAHRRRREEAAARSEGVPSAGEMLDRETTRLAVARLVYSLDEPYRTAVLCRYFENLPPREIAARLDVSAAAVETRLRRGREKLRARLDREFGDRKRWCAALLPLAGGTGAATATTAGGATATVLTGALVMSLKIKIGIAALVALAVAYAVWPRDVDEPPKISQAEVSKAAPRVAKKIGAAGPTPVEEAGRPAGGVEKETGSEPEAISLEPTPGSIVGVVTDESGAPIPDATVRALQFTPGSVELDEFLATRTDATGRYALKPIETRCVVEASTPRHYAGRRFANPFARADFVLGEPGALNGQLLRLPDKAPCADAVVAVYRWRLEDYASNASGLYAWRRPPLGVARSNPTGDFAFTRLRPGTYRLRVLPPGAPEVHTGRDVIEVHSGRETVRNLVVGAGIPVVGQVTDEDSGEPIVGAEVFQQGEWRIRGLTDEDGRYAITGSLAGGSSPPVFVAMKLGYLQYSVTMDGGAAFSSKHVRDLTMRRGAIVIGRVLDPDGTPVAGVRVGTSRTILTPRELATGYWLRWRTVFTDDSGKFELTVLPSPKPRRVLANHPRFAWSASEPFTVQAGDRKSGIVIQFEKGGSIGGRITGESGEPLASAQIMLFEEDCSRRIAYSGADGSYAIIGIPQGTYDLKILPAGVVTQNRSPYTGRLQRGIAVSEDRQSEVNVVVRRGRSIAGRVVDGNGRPVADALVRATPWFGGEARPRSDPHGPRDGLTDEEGRFRIEGLSDGGPPCAVQAMKPGFDVAWVRDPVALGRTDLLVTLDALKRLEGRVVYASTGEPALEYEIRGTAIAGPGAEKKMTSRFSHAFTFITDPDGRFRLDLQPGTYRMLVQTRDGYRSDPRLVELPVVGDPDFLELKVWRGVSLSGTVRTSRGKTPSMAFVAVHDLDTQPPKYLGSDQTDSDGRFDFPSLPAGRVLLEAHAAHDGIQIGAAREVVLVATTQPNMTLTLRRGTDVSVNVTGSDRFPIEGAKVTIERVDGVRIALRESRYRLVEQVRSALRVAGKYLTGSEYQKEWAEAVRRTTITDRDGKLAPLALLPGDYVIQATAPDRKPRRRTIRIGTGGPQVVNIVLEAE